MNKLKLVRGLVFILIAVLTIGLIYSSGKVGELQKKLKNLQPEVVKVAQEEQKLRAEYANSINENQVLKNENKALREDRDNLISRAKGLLFDANRMKELEDSLGRLTKDKETFEREKADLEKANAALKGEVAGLQKAQREIIQERDYAKSAYEKARKDNTIKKLKKEIRQLQREKDGKIAILQKDKKAAESSLTRAQKEITRAKEKNSKLEQDAERSDAQLKEYKMNYAEAEKKNKALETEIKNMPKKFTELARQNRRLFRQTAEMHYNLGVFYTKNKEYERAIAEFEKVIEITPDDAYAHFNLGYIYAEYLVNRKRAIENFRHYLRLAKSTDKDIDWAKKYLLTWETYEGKIPMR